MPTLDLLITFLVAAAIFAYMPGPSTLYAAAQTIARGQQAGWFAALGIHVGGYVHVLAAAFGLGLLFDAVPRCTWCSNIWVQCIWCGWE